METQIKKIIEDEMRKINDELLAAAYAYYNKDREIMSNFEYDTLYDRLVDLEKVHGVLLPDSITQSVGVSIYNEENQSLPKIEHKTPTLSLDKTKSRDELVQWLDDKIGCLSWKLDGSTVVITYENGHMIQAVTRGNGIIGEDVTKAAKKFSFVPLEISDKGRLVIRGEAIMTYSEFERINAQIEDVVARYKNPRNLASGTMRALDDSLLNERTIEFHPFTLVEMSVDSAIRMGDEGFDPLSYSSRLDYLSSPDMGFSSVEHMLVDAGNLVEYIDEMEGRIDEQDVPSDGLVLFFDNVTYGESLGSTSHAPRNGIAFKWMDETAKTHLTDIIWQPSRTGRINPVAIFEPVELEGTTVERATLNNVTFMRDMLGECPHIGQELTVYKANKIIPTIVSANKTFLERGKETGILFIPVTCPACENEAVIINEHGSEFLMCENPECPAKNHGSLVHFASRNALDIRGLSKETLTKFIDAGVVSSFVDIFLLHEKRDEIVGHIEGIGEKSFDNLCSAIEKARRTTAGRFIYALGIREVGKTASADIAKEFVGDVRKVVETGKAGNVEAFEVIDGIGNVMANEICSYMSNNSHIVEELLNIVEITDSGKNVKSSANDFIANKTFVVTGDVHIFAKRDELKEYIIENGGKLTSSVSKKTDYLITNSPDSGTSKNKKAQELGIPIITEDEFCQLARYQM